MELSFRELGEVISTCLLEQQQPAQDEKPPCPRCPWVVGKKYIIRTVTMTLTGELVRVGEKELVIKDAAWIADSGRWADCLKTGDYSEVEPFPDGEVIVGRGGVIDAFRISATPRSQK